MDAFLNHRVINNSHEFLIYYSQENETAHVDGPPNRDFAPKSFMEGCHMGHIYQAKPKYK